MRCLVCISFFLSGFPWCSDKTATVVFILLADYRSLRFAMMTQAVIARLGPLFFGPFLLLDVRGRVIFLSALNSGF